ncbi:MAG: hypothetical protein GDA56_14290 [Hormoscilla sp. GM7CHS1pb]|nr:hypothetical protein [Hormoscilla sp. GM7CHS1pb]
MASSPFNVSCFIVDSRANFSRDRDRLSDAVAEIGDNQVITRDNQDALRQEVETIKKF